MRASHLLIVNPRSANGSTGRLWPRMEGRLHDLLPPFDVAFTRGPSHATRLASEASGRYEVVVAVGGDGTVGEVVNGLIRDESALVQEMALGVIPRGTGSDFVRSLGVPRSLSGAAAVLARGRRWRVDVGLASFLGPDGRPASRYFVNAAEVGMGATVAEHVNRARRRLRGSAAFLWATLMAMVRYREYAGSYSVDGSPPEMVRLANAWIANGAYSGGGLRTAPRARLDDGLLDLVCVAHVGLLQRLRGFLMLRSGAFVGLPQVQYRQVRQVTFAAATPVPVETDGDCLGTTPATFEVLPGRLAVIC